MSTTAGAFDETRLQNIRLRAAALSFDDRIKQQLIPKIEVMNALLAVQTANLQVSLGRADKKYIAEIEWQNFCDMAVEDNQSCVVGGTKSSTNIETKQLDIDRSVPFSASESDFDDNDYSLDEAIAKQFIKADKELVEDLAATTMARINSFKGTNVLTGVNKATVSGNDTYIEAPYWTAEIMAYLARAAEMNKFTSPAMLSGGQLWEQEWVAQRNAANADGKGANAMLGTFPTYFDLFNVDQANTSGGTVTYTTYLLSMGSLAMANRARYEGRMVDYLTEKRYSMPSNFLPGLNYDVHYKTQCVAGDYYQHDFKVRMQAGIFNNPAGCDANNTGVLSFICGTAPA